MPRVEMSAFDSHSPGENVGSGTQAISRAATILRLIARCSADGAKLSEITRLAGLPHPTIHRILHCLIGEGLVVQDEPGRRYRLGPLNFELGLAVPPAVDTRRILRPILERIVAATGYTAFLTARSGAEYVCLDRVVGDSPARPTTLFVGGRRPLYVGAIGLALSACLDDSEIKNIWAAHSQELSQRPSQSLTYLRRAIELTRERGYATARDTPHVGTSSICMTVPNPVDRPIFAVAVATLSTRLRPEKVASLRDLLADELTKASGDLG